MTSKLTREQLRERTQRKVKHLAAAISQSAFTGVRTELEEELQIAEYALSCLESEPVADIVAWHHPTEERSCDIRWRRYDVKPGPLYTSPQPAPVVPDVMEPTIEAIKRILPTSNPDEYAACIGADMWNACRAAMLRGGKP